MWTYLCGTFETQAVSCKWWPLHTYGTTVMLEIFHYGGMEQEDMLGYCNSVSHWGFLSSVFLKWCPASRPPHHNQPIRALEAGLMSKSTPALFFVFDFHYFSLSRKKMTPTSLKTPQTPTGTTHTHIQTQRDLFTRVWSPQAAHLLSICHEFMNYVYTDGSTHKWTFWLYGQLEIWWA